MLRPKNDSVGFGHAQIVTPRQRLTLLMVMVFGHALKHTFNAAFFVLLPSIKTDLALSNTQVGTLSTFRGIIGGLANIPAGFLGDRYAKRRAEILGMSIVLVAVFAFALGHATNFWMAVIISSLFTVAITFWHPAAIASLSKEYGERKGFAIALHGTGGSIGETLGPILTGSLLAIISWRFVLQGSVVPGILFGIIIWSILRSVPGGHSSVITLPNYLRSVLLLLRDRRLLLVLLFSAGFAGGQSTVLTFLPIYLDEEMGFSSLSIGVYLSLAQVSGIVSQPIMGFASDRFGRKLILAPSLMLLSLSFIGISLVPAGLFFALVIFAMGAFLFPLMAILLASAMDLVSVQAQATTVSLVFGAAIVVSAYAPGIAGVLADSWGTASAFQFASGLVLFTALVATVTRWKPGT